MAKNNRSCSLNSDGDGKLMRSVDRFVIKLKSFAVHKTPLWEEIKRFGYWLESSHAIGTEFRSQETIQIKIDGDGIAKIMNAKKGSIPLVDCPKLWSFFCSLGIHQLKLDARLERNQVSDVISMLYLYRQILIKRTISPIQHDIVDPLLDDEGLHIACTCTSIQEETLIIAYSYCTLAFSRMVRFFERKQNQFNDHRALFNAAPLYTFLLTFLGLLPSFAYGVFFRNWIPCLISAVTVSLLSILTYLFFMVAGSMEYDNEEKEYQLNKARYKVRELEAQIETYKINSSQSRVSTPV